MGNDLRFWELLESYYPTKGASYCMAVAAKRGIPLTKNAIRKHMQRRGIRFSNIEEPLEERILPTESQTPQRRSEEKASRTHIVIPDTQCKPGVPLDHLLWAGRYIKEKQPDCIIHLGDHWDMPSLSSYEKPGSRYFEGKKVIADIAAGNKGLELLERGLDNFKPERKVLLRGNHEDRITRACNQDPKLDGLISWANFNDKVLGWEIADYLVPVEIDGIYYAHYFYAPGSGRPYTGSMDYRLKSIGFSFVQGHQQGFDYGRRELTNGKVQTGLVAGSFYQHNEVYRGPQAKNEWRGIIVLHEVRDGDYDIMQVSLDYLRRKFS